jgi:hypothetical protein
MAQQDEVLRWTPKKGYVLITPTLSSPPVITLEDGTVVTGVKTQYFTNNEGNNKQWLFPGLDKHIGKQGKISYAGQTGNLSLNPSLDFRGKGGVGNFKAAPTKGSGGGLQNSSYAFGQNPIQNAGDASNFVASPQYIDPSNYQDLTFPTIKNREITDEDILKTVRKNFGLQQESNNFAIDETNRTYPKIQDTVETAIDRRNEFAQDQLDKSYNKFPQIQESVLSQFKDSKVFKEGKIPDAVLNRRLTTSVQSKASDAARYLGAGADSGFASKTNDLLSAEEALKLRDKGDQLENTAIANAEKLIAKPQQYEANPEQYLTDFRKSTNVTANDTLNELRQNRELNSNIDTKNVSNNIDQQKYNLEKNIGIDLFNQGEQQKYQQSVNNLYLQSLQNEYQNKQQKDLLEKVGSNQSLSALLQLGLSTANKNSGLSNILNSIFGGDSNNSSFGNLWNWIKGIGGTVGSLTTSSTTTPSNASNTTTSNLPSNFGKFSDLDYNYDL